MKILLILLSLLLISNSIEAKPPANTSPKKLDVKELPPVFVKTPTHPEQHCIALLAYINTLPPDIQPYIRSFSFYYVPEEFLENQKLLFSVYLNTTSVNGRIVRPIEVPGTGGRLLAVNSQDLKWNVIAFSAVARRDKVFTEPNIDFLIAEGLRSIAGIVQDPVTLHVETIVPAPWFTREVQETDRSPAYYDLLYGDERFGKFQIGKQQELIQQDPGIEPKYPEEVEWQGGIWPADGKFYDKNAFKYRKKEEVEAYEKDLETYKAKKLQVKIVPVAGKSVVLDTKVKKDFPLNVKDFELKWGVTAVEAFLKAEKLVIKNGEVVAGAKSDATRGSYVSYNDRIITFLRVPTGTAMRTYDSLKTAMKKNYANFPEEAAIGDVPFDAGELLVNLPNGLQAAFLINGEGTRVEFGDSRAVRNTIDPFDVTVKTQIACMTCHAPQYGVVAPSNHKVKEAIKRGNAVITKDPVAKEIMDKFFEEWDDNLESWRAPYKKAIKLCTSTPKNPAGWTGQLLATENVKLRTWYDLPIRMDQAAAELGVPRLVVALLCKLDGSIDAGNLMLDEGVPRQVWDDDLFPKLVLIFASIRNLENPNPVLKDQYPELLRKITDPKKIK